MGEVRAYDSKYVEQLEADNKRLRKRIDSLSSLHDSAIAMAERFSADNERLRDPDWKTYIEVTERWLEKYPPDIFTGVSGDSGPLFVVAVRNAIAALNGVGNDE